MSEADHRHVRRLRLLDVVFELSSSDPSVFSLVDRMFGAPEFRPDGRVPGVRVWFDRDAVSRAVGDAPGTDLVPVGVTGEATFEVAEWTFRAFLTRSRAFHLVHAGSLVRSGRGVLLVGAPFAGKTTLTLALCREGFRYFSDDIGALARGDGRLHPFRRAAGVRRAAGGREYVAPDGDADPASAPGPCPLAWVFILSSPEERRTGAGLSSIVGRGRPEREDGPAVEGLSISDAALEVLRHTLNRAGRRELEERYGAHPHLRIFAELLEIVAGARCFRLCAGEPGATARMLRGIIDAGGPAPRRAGPEPAAAR
jgi:hypothetical protein